MTVESLACPNCGAALPAGSTGTMTCGFCNSTITLRNDHGAPSGRDKDALVRKLVEQKRTIEAVKLYKEAHDCTLREARDAVVNIAAGMGMTMGGGSSKLSCPFLAFLLLSWAGLMIGIPLLAGKALFGGSHASADRSDLVQSLIFVFLLVLSFLVVIILAKRSARLKRNPPGSHGGS